MSEGIQRQEGSGKGSVRGGIGIPRDRVPRYEEKWGYAIRVNGGDGGFGGTKGGCGGI